MAGAMLGTIAGTLALHSALTGTISGTTFQSPVMHTRAMLTRVRRKGPVLLHAPPPARARAEEGRSGTGSMFLALMEFKTPGARNEKRWLGLMAAMIVEHSKRRKEKRLKEG